MHDMSSRLRIQAQGYDGCPIAWRVTSELARSETSPVQVPPRDPIVSGLERGRARRVRHSARASEDALGITGIELSDTLRPGSKAPWNSFRV